MTSPIQSVLETGDFATHFCKHVSSYLTDQETASMASACQLLHNQCTLRVATEGRHPLVDNTFKSILETRFYQREHQTILNRADGARTQATERLKSYIDINPTDAGEDAEQIRSIAEKYPKIMAAVAKIDVIHENLPKNRYISQLTRSKAEWSLRANFYALCEEALTIEKEVQDRVDSGIVKLQPRMVF